MRAFEFIDGDLAEGENSAGRAGQERLCQRMDIEWMSQRDIPARDDIALRARDDLMLKRLDDRSV